LNFNRNLRRHLLVNMVHQSSVGEHANDLPFPSPRPHSHQVPSEDGKEKASASFSPNESSVVFPDGALHKTDTEPSARRLNLFMVFITLTQLVQMIPLGAGINSSLAIGAALGATRIQSVWIVASYPLTQGSFVLIGERLPHQDHVFACRARLA
jgi:hypothetical protein